MNWADVAVIAVLLLCAAGAVCAVVRRRRAAAAVVAAGGSPKCCGCPQASSCASRMHVSVCADDRPGSFAFDCAVSQKGEVTA